MALTAAQLLDELMGRDRNLVPGEKSTQVHWSHDDVCKHFLCGFCANDLFVNTKADLGVCNKVHDEVLKQEYEKSSRYGKMGFEEDFIRYLNGIQSDVERKIRRGHERLLTNKVKEAELAETDNDKTKMITDHINSLLEEIEQLGSEGKVDEAQGVSRVLDQLKEEREQSKIGSGMAGQEKQMEVCEVCGAFLIVGDVQSRVDDHLQGKQHVGYAKIKTTIEDMKEKPWLNRKPKEIERQDNDRKDDREKDRDRDKDHDRERERDRDRDRDRERDRENRSRRSSGDRSRDKRRRSRSRSRERHRERRRSRDRHDKGRSDRDRERRRSRDRDRDRRDRDRDRDSHRSKRRSRSRSRDRGSKRRSRSRDSEEKRSSEEKIDSRHSSRDDHDRPVKEEATDKEGGRLGESGDNGSETDAHSSRVKDDPIEGDAHSSRVKDEPTEGECSKPTLNNDSAMHQDNNSEGEYSNATTQDYSSTVSAENSVSDEVPSQSLPDDVANLPTQDYVSNLPTQDYSSNVFTTSNQSTPKYTSILPSEDFTSDSIDNVVNFSGDSNDIAVDIKIKEEFILPFPNVMETEVENDDYM